MNLFECKRSPLFIHFDTAINLLEESKNEIALVAAIGPNNQEIVIGFNLREGIIRCYM